jgi:hypothetical protein
LPLEAFLEGLRISSRGGEIRPTARAKPAARRERRRPDPLLGGSAKLEEWYQIEPWRTSREFQERVQAKYLERYADGRAAPNQNLARCARPRVDVWTVR